MPTFHNSLSRSLETFKPIKAGRVGLYTCGPTVYNFAHLGNLRTYIFEDILRRVLAYNGYKVKHAMNITDVGHLVGETEGEEDKMDVGAKREGKHPLEIAKEYEKAFFEDCASLNILPPSKVLRATETIDDQIKIIQKLEKKGFIYGDELAIYFDTSKLKNYGKLSGQKLSEKKTGARQEIVIDNGKRNPQDFVLWFFLAGRYKNHILRWPSPWGDGFPGWHIECSAISRKILGQPFDIHTGGVDHIGTHHANEIAQSEAAFGAPLANYWMHGEFLLVDSGKMAKSADNFLTLKSMIERGFDPLAFRYLTLSAHYRAKLNFTLQSLAASQRALYNLYEKIGELSSERGGLQQTFEKKFTDAVNQDLDTPKALAVTWELVKSDVADGKKLATLAKFDEVLGLELLAGAKLSQKVPEEIRILVERREEARSQKNFARADVLRKEIENKGYSVKDTPTGPQAKRKN